MARQVTSLRSRGFGLVEIMVAMLIAMLGIIIIFQVFAVQESVNRTTTSGSDAQQNGAYSVAVIEQEARTAGWGFNSTRALGCNVLAYNATLGPLTYTLAPILINAAATVQGSDGLEINGGTQNLLVGPVAMFQNQTTSTDPFIVANRYGFQAGDVFLAVEPSKSCTLAQVSALPASPSNQLTRTASGTYPYNNPTGSGVVYTTNGYVVDLGPAPLRDVFQVVNNQLTVTSALTSNTQQVVADGIVQLKAQYGKDTSNPADGIVDVFDNVAPTTAAGWNQVLVVRVALVARSAQPEKPSNGGTACDTTTAAPTWSGGTFDLTATANWMCYRYKTFETVIPVKNILWSQG